MEYCGATAIFHKNRKGDWTMKELLFDDGSYLLTPKIGGTVLIFPKDRSSKEAAQNLLKNVDGAYLVLDIAIDDQIYYGVLVDLGEEKNANTCM
jgi:hypothetical protein